MYNSLCTILRRQFFEWSICLNILKAAWKKSVSDYQSSIILIAGDFNQLPGHDLRERTDLLQIFHQPTRGYSGSLAWMYLSIVASIVKSNHKAIMVSQMLTSAHMTDVKQSSGEITARPVTSSRLAQFLFLISLCVVHRHSTRV